MTELTKATGMSKSIVQRLLYTLEKEGYLIKNDKNKTYKLSMKFFVFGSIALKESHVADVAKPYLTKLRDQIGESVSLCIINDQERMIVAFLTGHHEIQMVANVGQRVPLYAGAPSKVLLAFLSDDEIEKILNQQPIRKITENTLTDRAEIWREILKIRMEGYAVSTGESIMGGFSISFPIFDVEGKIVASLSTILPLIRYKEEKITEYIKLVGECARRVCYELGVNVH